MVHLHHALSPLPLPLSQLSGHAFLNLLHFSSFLSHLKIVQSFLLPFGQWTSPLQIISIVYQYSVICLLWNNYIIKIYNKLQRIQRCLSSNIYLSKTNKDSCFDSLWPKKLQYLLWQKNRIPFIFCVIKLVKKKKKWPRTRFWYLYWQKVALKSETLPIDFDNLQSKAVKLTKSHLWILNKDLNIQFNTFATAVRKHIYLRIKLRTGYKSI